MKDLDIYQTEAIEILSAMFRPAHALAVANPNNRSASTLML